MVEEFLGLGPDDFGSAAPRSVAGDGIRLARDAGGDVVVFPANRVPLLPGWPSETRAGFQVRAGVRVAALLHRRPAGQEVLRRLVLARHRRQGAGRRRPSYPVLPGLGRAAPPALRARRDAARRRLPGRSRPLRSEPARAGDAPRHRPGRARRDGSAVQRQRRRDGGDLEWGRGTNPFVRRYTGDPTHHPNPLLGSVAEPPFFGMRLRLLGTGIGSTGIRTDAESRVLDPAGRAATPGSRPLAPVRPRRRRGRATTAGSPSVAG